MEVESEVSSEEEYLITQIENEMRKIYTSVEKLYNNFSFSEVQDPLEKCFISTYSYSSCLTGRGATDSINTSEDLIKKFEESLQRELDSLIADMDHLVMKVEERKEKINNTDRNFDNLNKMMEAHKNESTKPKPGMDTIMKNIKLRFRKEKSDLKAIISKLFADNMDIQDLIARIIEYHFTEGADKYLQLEDTDDSTEQVELLRRTGLFDINPHDPLQIKLADLV